MAASTRKSLEFPIFDRVCELKRNQLPTHADCLKSILFKKRKNQIDSGGQQPSISIICKEVCSEVMTIYASASIPSLSETRIIELLKKYHSKYTSLLKSYKARCNVESFKSKTDEFLDDSKILFDFACCKCDSFDSCSCSKAKKIPRIE